MKKENVAIIEMLVCAALWSIAGIFIKLVPWNGFAVAGLRSLVAGMTLAVYMAIKRYKYVLKRPLYADCFQPACIPASYAPTS